jgi:type I restriction enzyme S subunit
LVINSDQGRRHIKSVVTQQVGQANVNGTKLKAFPLPVPPIAEQRRLLAEHHEVVSAQNAICLEIDIASKKATALRQSLLIAAFAGQLTPECAKELVSV